MKKNINHLGESIFKKRIYILLITIIFAITGAFYTLTNVKCMASQKILLGTSENSNLTETYKEFITGSTVLEKVIQNLNRDISVEELSSSIQVEVLKEANIIEIKVFGTEKEIVQQNVAEISKVFMEMVAEIYGDTTLYDVDSTAHYYTTGNSIMVGFGSGVLGCLLACLFFAICTLLDTKVKSSKDIENITNLKTLISIPRVSMLVKKKLTSKNIRAHKSEIFKKLMTNIQFVSNNNLASKSILITSANPFEGKTYVANNLAMEFAKAGKKVILIDSDMRRGKLAKIHNLPNDLGFSNYLAGLDSNGNVVHERITRFIKDTEIKNLNVITAGNIPPNPTELLKTSKMEELIKDLKVFYDVIVFDGVAVLEAPEAAILSKVCDLSLILSSYHNTKKEDLKIACETLENTENTVISVGLNNVPEKKLKKKMMDWKNIGKLRLKNIQKKLKNFGRKFKILQSAFHEIKLLGRVIIAIVAFLLMKMKKAILGFFQRIKNKSYDVKDYIKSHIPKREKTKLIEAGDKLPEEKNVIKEVFENEISKLETQDEIEFREKLEHLKISIEEKNVASKMEEETLKKVRPVVNVRVNQSKSKFDLIREQQEKENLEEEKTVSPQLENESSKVAQKVAEVPEKIDEIEAMKAKQKQERERKEAEKKREQEQMANDEEINFGEQEYLTEEMIRKQVEMDEMVRLAEREEEEEIFKAKQIKRRKKFEKKQERKERFQNWMENIREKKEKFNKRKAERQVLLQNERSLKNEVKIERKIKRDVEKSENRARIAKVKEEKRAYREMEKQRHREELRIQEELHEDNLYPKPRM